MEQIFGTYILVAGYRKHRVGKNLFRNREVNIEVFVILKQFQIWGWFGVIFLRKIALLGKYSNIFLGFYMFFVVLGKILGRMEK